MRRLMTGWLMVLMLVCVAPAGAQPDAARAAHCSTYARNRAETESAPGRGMLGGAAGGALFGAIIGGGRGAGRGAALGAAIGGIGGGLRSREYQQSSYYQYYEACMRGN